MKPLTDVAAERGVLSGICRYGHSAFVDVADIVRSETFTIDYNQIIFSCIEHVFNNDDIQTIDLALIYSAGEELSLGSIMSRPEMLEHVKSLFNFPIELSNVRKLAIKIRKLQITRLLRDKLKTTSDNLLELSGNETLTEILGIAENSIFDFASLINDSDEKPKSLTETVTEHLQHLTENPIDQVGVPTGFDRYDKAIGGGLRPGTINVIGARSKAQPLDCKILTPDGWKLMKDIRVGDTICNPLNKTGLTKVVKIFPQPQQECLEFVFSDNTKTRASADHKWLVRNARWQDNNRFEEWSFNEMLDNVVDKSLFLFNKRPKWQFPLTKPVIFHKKSLLIDPYVLGCLLGDGCLKYNRVEFTNQDQEIINILNNRLPYEHKFTKQKSKKYGYRLNSNRKNNIIREHLKTLNLLGKGSHDKFIPKEYLYSSVEDRTLLLCGLLDTDGGVANYNIEYTTVSKQLRDDVCQLVYSLGGKCRFKERYTSYDKKQYFKSYRLNISFNNNKQYFLLSRKRNLATTRKKTDLKRSLISVKSLGKCNMQCIQVDDPNGLYITDDYIVTHNCGKSLVATKMAYNIAKNNIPVLVMDTEMTYEDHLNRLLAMASDNFIYDIETGQFAKKPNARKKVEALINELTNKKIPYFHKSIAGMPFEEQLAVMRRWIIKEVGVNHNNEAKPCVIFYDYLKLMDSSSINNNIAEFQALGFIMSTLHNFTVKYKIPILSLIQLNRDGVTKEGTEVASGSDRIIWLCSNFTILKEKSAEEISLDGLENGNLKLVPIVCRHGEGMEYGNYINCYRDGAKANITEGPTKFEVRKSNEENQ